MSSIRTGVGLFSGIDIASLTETLISAQRAPARRLELRVAEFQGVQAGVQALEANILTLGTSVSQLGRSSTFDRTTISNSDIPQLTVTTSGNVTPGSYSFQARRLATAEQRVSRGFANADTQLIGEGSITLARGGRLATSTRLDTFNGGEGVRRGSFRITDRSGSTATIDLSSAYSIDDVLTAINDNADIDVTATTSGGRIVLTDNSGSATSNLIVEEIGNGKTAGDLGLVQSVASDSLTGSEVYYLTGDFTFDQLNDGNTLHQVSDVPDFKITLQDATELEIDLDGKFNLDDVIDVVNSHADNGGKLTASLSNGRLVLTDNTGGGGTLSIADINGAAVVSALGLDNAASGNTISGDRLLAGLGSRLLRNIQGGAGITTPGQISITDRAGRTATLDLASAESLDEVITAINAAEDGGNRLSVTARIDSTGTGIELLDDSGASASNLIVADVGGGSVAADLGIAIDDAVNSVASGSLNLRHVNHATLLKDYAPDGGGIQAGSFLITDSAGNQASITISSSITTVGGVLQRINAAGTIQVTARLNDTGDGFVLVDNAGGAGELQVEEISGTTAADLRIAGTGTVGGSGSPEISSRRRTEITVEETDTLQSLTDRINRGSFGINAAIVNDGSAFNAFRLSLTSAETGTAGRFVIDTGALELGLETTVHGNDALLQVGDTTASSYLLASSTNAFTDVVSGVNVTAKTVGESAARVSVNRDTNSAKNALKGLVSAYNAFIDTSDTLTKFDPDETKRGILQGQGIVFRIQNRLSSLVNRRYTGGAEDVQTLADLGIRTTSGGKLSFDESQFDSAIAANPTSVQDFFLDKTDGVGKRFDDALTTLTDSISGTFHTETESLQNSIDALQSRIDQIDAVLAVRQERLLNEFIQMESIIGKLQSQGDALTALSAIATQSNKS